jgi:hypothetical protein
MLTQERLKELFHYDPETGVFTRLVRTSSQGNLGVIKNKLHIYGYLYVGIDGKAYRAHRLAWLYVHGRFPLGEIDHVNHDRADNKIANLREVTSQENSRNAAKGINNTSGFVGVTWEKANSTWRSYIQVNRKRINLGSFQNKQDAIAAREAANIKYGFHDNHGKELFDTSKQLVYKQRCRNGKTQQQKGQQHEFRF